MRFACWITKATGTHICNNYLLSTTVVSRRRLSNTFDLSVFLTLTHEYCTYCAAQKYVCREKYSENPEILYTTFDRYFFLNRTRNLLVLPGVVGPLRRPSWSNWCIWAKRQWRVWLSASTKRLCSIARSWHAVPCPILQTFGWEWSRLNTRLCTCVTTLYDAAQEIDCLSFLRSCVPFSVASEAKGKRYWSSISGNCIHMKLENPWVSKQGT
jgi:hypothetical protein